MPAREPWARWRCRWHHSGRAGIARPTGKFASLASLNLEAMYELAAPSTPEEVRNEVERRVAAGELVNGSKSATPSSDRKWGYLTGMFLPWIETEFDLHEQSARRFMQVADRFGKSNTVLGLPIRLSSISTTG
jgi:hypothetical protein